MTHLEDISPSCTMKRWTKYFKKKILRCNQIMLSKVKVVMLHNPYALVL